MILFDFEHESAATPEAAVNRLIEIEGDARLLAGGTDLLPNMRIGIARPEHLIGLSGIATAKPAVDSLGWLTVDALSTLASLEHDPLVGKLAPILAASAHTVAGNQIRQRATLGGNLCQETRCLYLNQKHDFQFVEPCYKRGGECCYPFPRNKKEVCWSVYMSDVAPSLMAWGGEISVLGAGGLVRMPIENLFTGDGLRPLTLNPGELIRWIHLPPLPRQTGWGYHKSSVRGGLEFGMAVMALTLSLEADKKTCKNARIAIGAVNEGPVFLHKTAKAMQGRQLDKDSLAELALQASEEVNPLPHHGFTKAQLRDNIRVYLKRTMESALEKAQKA
jgi:4-hydroxybenzoyl-CoA reductase beta subunit